MRQDRAPDNLVFTGIPSDRAAAMWPAVGPVIAPAVARTNGAYTTPDVLDAILDGQMQLWAAFDRSRCTAALVGEVKSFPSGMVLCKLLFCAGAVIPDCVDFMPVVEAWARAAGCTRIQLIGRPGWSKLLTSFAVSAVVLEKDLTV